MKKRVHYFTNLAPHYRQRLWELLAQDRELEVLFYSGKPVNGSIREMSFDDLAWQSDSGKVNSLKNRRLFNRVVWQDGVLSKVLFEDIQAALFLGDMNIISTWLSAFILRLKGAKIYFWGHGFSGHETVIKKYFRIFFNKLAHQHFIYGQRAKSLMMEYGFSDSEIHIIYNSLDYETHRELRISVLDDSDIKALFQNSGLPVLAFIGRLTPVKKLDLLIKAVHRLNKENTAYNLLIIGDGPMQRQLEEMANNLLIDGTFYFYGACYDEAQIGRLLANADLCVSPGNVGLTAIHSLSFGTPVCSHNNLGNQMPEYEAIEPGKTGFLFKEDDVDDLVFKIKEWFNYRESREKIREQCYAVIDEKYNPQHQIEIFKNVLLSDE